MKRVVLRYLANCKVEPIMRVVTITHLSKVSGDANICV